MITLPKHLSITYATPPCWRVVSVRYFDANRGEGNQSANIYVRTKNSDGGPLDVAVLQTWPDGGRAEKTTEWKDRFQIDGDVEDGVGYSGCDFFMSRDGYRPTHDAPGPYSIRVSEAVRSDTISGFGLAPNRSHDTYRVEFQWIESDTPKPPPDNPPPPDNYVTQLQMENYCSHFMTNEEFTSALREYLDVLENMIKKWS